MYMYKYGYFIYTTACNMWTSAYNNNAIIDDTEDAYMTVMYIVHTREV